MDLKGLYSQIITENSRAAHNRRPVPGATVSLEGNNPSCGDDIVLQVKIENGIVEDIGFIGSGCAISQASASLMIDLIKGKTVEEAKNLETMLAQYSPSNEYEGMKDSILAIVSNFVAYENLFRVSC